MLKFRAGFLALVALAFAVASAPLSAQTTFGSQPTLTFGGTGIPNNAVVTNSNSGSLGLLLGLTATQRCGIVDCGPALTNDGVNTFFATAGKSNNPPSPLDPYGLWNFDIAVVGSNAGNYNYRLLYDFDPAVGNGGLGSILIGPTPFQDSWNLGMNFLAIPIGGVLIPPTWGAFDPTVNGEYYFKLAAYNQTGAEVAYSDMKVDVGGNVVPEPGTMGLLATGLVGMAGAGLRRRKKLVG